MQFGAVAVMLAGGPAHAALRQLLAAQTLPHGIQQGHCSSVKVGKTDVHGEIALMSCPGLEVWLALCETCKGTGRAHEHSLCCVQSLERFYVPDPESGMATEGSP